ncbi:hypothetical protein HAX54_014813, partial [Datura stramonium]|nr:hypothetical protein [Datura stramonium]
SKSQVHNRFVGTEIRLEGHAGLTPNGVADALARLHMDRCDVAYLGRSGTRDSVASVAKLNHPTDDED